MTQRATITLTVDTGEQNFTMTRTCSAHFDAESVAAAVLQEATILARQVRLNYKQPDACPHCRGKGGAFEPSIAHTDHWVPCTECGGNGVAK